MQGRTWDSIPVPGISVKDLDKDALNVFKKKAVESQRLDKKSASVSLLNLLLNLHCVCKQWLVNRNAVILATRGSILFSITVWILLRRMTIPNHQPLITAAKPLTFRDHVHEFRVEAFGVVVLWQIVVERFAF